MRGRQLLPSLDASPPQGARRVSRFLHETVYENLAHGNMNCTQSETVMSLMTPLERRMARKALSQLLASEGNWTDAQARAAKSAMEKLGKPDPASRLRDCLDVAFRGFAVGDDGEVWAATLIKRTRRVLRDTAPAGKNPLCE